MRDALAGGYPRLTGLMEGAVERLAGDTAVKVGGCGTARTSMVLILVWCEPVVR